MSDAIVECDDCGSIVELTRQNDRTLALTCECPQLVHVRVDRTIPREWTNE
jgi:hypothetical protein